jgi:hypothetical protein
MEPRIRLFAVAHATLLAVAAVGCSNPDCPEFPAAAEYGCNALPAAEPGCRPIDGNGPQDVKYPKGCAVETPRSQPMDETPECPRGSPLYCSCFQMLELDDAGAPVQTFLWGCPM